MLFYIYELVELLILSTISINLSIISDRSSIISYKLLIINHKLSVNLSINHYFYHTKLKLVFFNRNLSHLIELINQFIIVILK